MTDNHIHIGQWYETYYEAGQVFDAVFDTGVESIAFSSTTNCAGGVLYRDIEREIGDALSGSGAPAGRAVPFLWFVPAFARQGVTVEKAMRSLPYAGIKIHPRANSWDVQDSETAALAHSLFDYAEKNGVPVLIHTGEDSFEAPDKFSAFFAEYPGAKIILAHGRPADKTIEMMRRYPNVRCDTAFMGEESLARIAENGFAPRVLPGSDFPITHYWNRASGLTLREQYKEDYAALKKLARLIPPGTATR